LEFERSQEVTMRTSLSNVLAAAALLAMAPFTAYAQNAGGLAGPNGPLVLPNTSGTITYQNSGGTSTAPGGTTVFHGTGSTTTITFAGSGTTTTPTGTGGIGTLGFGPNR
jgi:hypothetical protein